MSEREMWSALKSTLALTFLIGACGEDSVGRDSCLGEGTRCGALTELRTPNTRRIGSLSTRELATLEPVWERRLPVGMHQGAGNISALAGNARDGLWYVRHEIDGERMAVYKLDDEGEVESEDLIEPPSTSAVAATLASGEAIRNVSHSGQTLIHTQGGPPIFAVSWGVTCNSDYLCGHWVDELIALPVGSGGEPWRMITDDYDWNAARTADGGLWFYAHERGVDKEDGYAPLRGRGILRKYDAQGIAIDQGLLAEFRPFGSEMWHPSTVISVSSRQELYVYCYPKGSDDGELWSFDARGNLRWRVRREGRTGIHIVVDQRDQPGAVLYESDR